MNKEKLRDLTDPKKQKAKDLELAKADAENLKKQLNEIVKKDVSDKKALIDFVESLEFQNAIPEMENSELQIFLDQLIIAINETKKDIISAIEKL